MDLKTITETRLKGAQPDPVAMVDDLFEFCFQNGSVAARQEENKAIMFQVNDGSPFRVPIEGAQSRFRFLCARLCKLSNDLDSTLRNIYQGFSTMPYGAGVIRIECENTLANHFFKLTYEANNRAGGEGGSPSCSQFGTQEPAAPHHGRSAESS
jgi:hypothetical protein